MSVPSRPVALFRRLLPYGNWLVLALAAVLRLWNLGYPKTLVFDETYYVKDAWSLWHHGYESSWPTGANDAFTSGHLFGYLNSGAFVVHPPLGKWLIGLPMVLFGAENSWTWRLTVALFGIGLVWLLMAVAKRLTGSRSFSILAGFLLAIDGHAIVMARIALLDGILAFFALLAFYFLLRDRQATALRYQLMAIRGQSAVIWNRPWLVACASALGLATSVKWSGLYFAAFFGLYVVVSEMLLRRRLGIRHAIVDGLVGQGVANLVLMLPIYAGIYLTDWLGWILNSGGWDRGYGGNWWSALLYYHQQIYGFHVNLHTPHNYASNPLTWLFLGRPVAFWYQGVPCPGIASGCSEAIQAIGNPLIWWAAFAAILWLSYRFVRGLIKGHTDRTIGLILLGIGAGYLPWLLYLGRTVFQFYTISFEAFSILALAYAISSLWYGQHREVWRRYITAYLVVTCLVSVFYLNLWWGFETPYWFWLIHMWLGNFWI